MDSDLTRLRDRLNACADDPAHDVMELHRLQAQYCKALRRRIDATINISVDTKILRRTIRMSKAHNAELQARVQQYLREHGMSQAKLAQVTGINKAIISQWLRGQYTGDITGVE